MQSPTSQTCALIGGLCIDTSHFNMMLTLPICSCRLAGFDKINIAENALNLHACKLYQRHKTYVHFVLLVMIFRGVRVATFSFGTGMKSSKISFVSRDGAEELIPFR